MAGTPNYDFFGALVSALRADTGVGSLVELTSHSSGDLRIARGKPDRQGKLPFLGVRQFTSAPALVEAVASYRVSIVQFSCLAEKDLPALKIVDRIEHLLKASGNLTDRDVFSFSDSNLTSKQVRWLRTEEVEKKDETDSWQYDVFAEFHWIDVPCV